MIEMVKPTVSVIVPVYNSEKTLSRCIESVLNQSFKEFQLFLVDDGSQDSSREICRKYADENENIFYSELTHGGISSTRNTGIKQAKGEFICFLDSDDFFDSNMLETMSEEAYLHNADVVITSFKRVYGSTSVRNEKLDEIKGKRYEKNNFREVLSHFFSPSGSSCYITTYLIRREKCPLFDEEISFMEDAEFISRLFCTIDSVYINDSDFYNHLENISGISGNPEMTVGNIRGIIRSEEKIRNHFSKSEWSDLIEPLEQMICHAIVNRLLNLRKLSLKRIISAVRECLNNDELIGIFRNVDLNAFSGRMRMISILIIKRSVVPVSLLIKVKGLF